MSRFHIGNVKVPGTITQIESFRKAMALCSGMVAPSIPEGWLSVAGQMAQQSPEYSYSRELIINAVKKAGLTDDEILRFYLGNYSNEESGTRILDKMTLDLFNGGSKDSGLFT